jgi:hypothetical protein
MTAVTAVVFYATTAFALGSVVIVTTAEGTVGLSTVGDEGVTLIVAKTLTQGHLPVVIGRSGYARRPATSLRPLLPCLLGVDTVQNVGAGVHEVPEPTHRSLDSREGIRKKQIADHLGSENTLSCTYACVNIGQNTSEPDAARRKAIELADNLMVY